jgi:hypothetical protein
MPRLFMRKVAFGIKAWCRQRDRVINKLTYETLTKTLEAIHSQTGIDNISHKLFLIRRKDLNETEDLDSLDEIKIITPNVENKLLKKGIVIEKSQLVNLYSMTCVAPYTSRVAGVFYEGYCVKQMSGYGIHLNLLKMVRLSPSPGRRRRLDYDAPRFHSLQSFLDGKQRIRRKTKSTEPGGSCCH